MIELAQRLDVAVTSVSSLERNEVLGTAKAVTVQRALAAMGKEPVVVVVDALSSAEVADIESTARKHAVEEAQLRGQTLNPAAVELAVARAVLLHRLGT